MGNKKQTLENIENIENVEHFHTLVFLEHITQVIYIWLCFLSTFIILKYRSGL